MPVFIGEYRFSVEKAYDKIVKNVKKEISRRIMLFLIDTAKQWKTQKDYDTIKLIYEWQKRGRNYHTVLVKQVGAIIVKDGMIISDGYNGTPGGFDNCL